MKVTIEKALEITQMIVPEVDISYEIRDNRIYVPGVEMHDWKFYLSAMENASDLLIMELDKQPDVYPITEIEPIATDLNCLITCMNMFYLSMMSQLEEIYQKSISKSKASSDSDLKRFSKYRKIKKKPGRKDE